MLVRDRLEGLWFTIPSDLPPTPATLRLERFSAVPCARVSEECHATGLSQICQTYMKAAKPKDTATSRWLSFRPEIKVLDCTIRDGGLMNNHHFDDQIVKAVYTACVAGGIDYMELG